MSPEDLEDLMKFAEAEGGVIAEDEHGGFHAFAPLAAQELKTRGILTRRAGRWRILQKDTALLGGKFQFLSVCDFCSQRPVEWRVECNSFVDVLGTRNIGAWAACGICGELVQQQKKSELIEWIMDQSHSKGTPAEWAVREVVKRNQALFWKNFKSITKIPPTIYGH